MKKLIITAAFLVFGTVFMTAQTTNKKNTTSKLLQKSATRGMKSTTKGTKMVDTANLEKRQKVEDDKLKRQTVPQKDGLYNESVQPVPPTPGQTE